MTSAPGWVIVAGYVNADLIVQVEHLPRAGETVHGHDLVQQGGGKGANQSVAASRMGGRVALIGAVGGDEFGRTVLAALSADGIHLEACQTFPGEHTGLALIVVDEAGENQIAVAPGANARLDAALMDTALARLDPPPGSVCLATLELGDDAVLTVLRWADQQGLRLVLNPAPARPLLDEIMAAGPILTPNETEAAMLSQSDDPEVAAGVLAARTGSPVIVSLGAQGALLWAQGRAIRLPAMPVAAVDTTGAGDALNGILAAELAAGRPLEEALRVAMVGAALSTTRAGAQAGLPRREEVVAAMRPS